MSVWKRVRTSMGLKEAPKSEPITPLDMLGLPDSRRPVLPPPTSVGKIRLHLFFGDFAHAQAAQHYCYYAEDGRPEDLNRELPDAAIDTEFVEVCFGEVEDRVWDILAPAEAAKMMKAIGTANTLVIIAEPAFGGLAYALNDTTRLTYLGPLVVAGQA